MTPSVSTFRLVPSIVVQQTTAPALSALRAGHAPELLHRILLRRPAQRRSMVLIKEVMNSKLITGHSTTGYGLTQITTVLDHGQWTKERDGRNVRPTAQF